MILAEMALKIKNAEMSISRASQAVDEKEKAWESGAAAVALHVQAMSCDVTTDVYFAWHLYLLPLSRLEKKGILYKMKGTNNKNALTAHFTNLGAEAIEQHHNMRAFLQKEYEHYLDTITDDDKQVIKNFL